jgi:hypothetical protein
LKPYKNHGLFYGGFQYKESYVVIHGENCYDPVPKNDASIKNIEKLFWTFYLVRFLKQADSPHIENSKTKKCTFYIKYTTNDTRFKT